MADGRTSATVAADRCVVDFAEFKRQMVRLDYVAQRLRRARQDVEDERLRSREALRRALADVQSRADAVQQRRIDDELDTLRLESEARGVSERQRTLRADVMLGRQQVQHATRKRIKVQQSVDRLEEFRLLLNDIITHQGSIEHGQAATVHNPAAIRAHLSNKERNVISQSELVLQACQLCQRCTASTAGAAAAPSSDAAALGRDVSKRGVFVTAVFQCPLKEDVFATIHRLNQRFVAAKSCSSAVNNSLAAIERYVYHLLELVDACEPAMLARIIAKVVANKSKQLEAQRARQQAEHRERRERTAQANAASAPATFRRVVVVGRRTQPKTTLASSQAVQQQQQSTAASECEPDISHLFCLQI